MKLDNGGHVELQIRSDSYRGRYAFRRHHLEHEHAMTANFPPVSGLAKRAPHGQTSCR